MPKITRCLGAFLGLALLSGALGLQAEETQWQKDHPARAKVNRRLNKQEQRIEQGEASGKLSPEQAQQLRQKDANIRQEARQEAKANGGRLSKSEKRELNRKLDRNSKAIHDAKHPVAP